LEKNLIQSLDKILEISSKVRSKYQDLRKKNVELEVQLSDLKVEADQYKQENIKLKKELGERIKGDNKTMLVKTDSSSPDISTSGDVADAKNQQIKLQLDEFIEEIDQCIQIIQAKDNA
jgi:cell shape-determining protein MreC